MCCLKLSHRTWWSQNPKTLEFSRELNSTSLQKITNWFQQHKECMMGSFSSTFITLTPTKIMDRQRSKNWGSLLMPSFKWRFNWRTEIWPITSAPLMSLCKSGSLGMLGLSVWERAQKIQCIGSIIWNKFNKTMSFRALRRKTFMKLWKKRASLTFLSQSCVKRPKLVTDTCMDWLRSSCLEKLAMFLQILCSRSLDLGRSAPPTFPMIFMMDLASDKLSHTASGAVMWLKQTRLFSTAPWGTIEDLGKLLMSSYSKSNKLSTLCNQFLKNSNHKNQTWSCKFQRPILNLLAKVPKLRRVRKSESYWITTKLNLF